MSCLVLAQACCVGYSIQILNFPAVVVCFSYCFSVELKAILLLYYFGIAFGNNTFERKQVDAVVFVVVFAVSLNR